MSSFEFGRNTIQMRRELEFLIELMAAFGGEEVGEGLA
jgi:hypothetical protein